MDRWFQIRTIAAIARHGTVSAAARELQLHRATVLRHVDLMEDSLGVRLFLRHARGYTPTPAALELASVVQRAQSDIAKIVTAEQIDQGSVSGRVTITATSLMAQTFMPYLAAEVSDTPSLYIHCLTGVGIEALEDGKVDIAIRIGQKPKIPEYVVQSLGEIRFGLYGSPAYISRNGHPKDVHDLEGHIFAGPLNDGPRVGPLAWLLDNVPDAQFQLRSDDAQVLSTLVFDGQALGTIPTYVADKAGLVSVIVEAGLWTAPLWAVTHRDAHRSKRVQFCLSAIKDAVKQRSFMDDLAVEPIG